MRRMLLAALGVAVVVPAVAVAFTLIELLVVIAIIGESMGLFVPSQVAGTDCRGERTSVSVTLAGDLAARLVVGRSEGSFDYHIRPVALTGTGAHDVRVRLVGAANGTATSGEPFDVVLRVVGSSDRGRINTTARVALVIAPNPGDRTAEARVLRVVAKDPCDPRGDQSDAASATQAEPADAVGLEGTAAFAGAAFAGVLALTALRRRRRAA